MLQTMNNNERNTIIKTSKFRSLHSNVVYSVLTRSLLGEHCVNINRSSFDPLNRKSVMD